MLVNREIQYMYFNISTVKHIGSNTISLRELKKKELRARLQNKLNLLLNFVNLPG